MNWSNVRQRWRTAPPRKRQTWRLTAGSAAVGLTLALTAVAVAGPWDSGQRTAERARAAGQEPDRDSGAQHTGQHTGQHTDDPRGARDRDALPKPAPSAPAVLTALRNAAPPPTRSALADALEPLLEDPSLGPLRTASVVDVSSGKELFSVRAGTNATPASTIKLGTAAAALSALGPDHRIPTRAVWDPDKRRITLVGGGDPTLTEKRLTELAEATARTVRKRGLKPRTLAYDTSRYAGPSRHPIGVNNNIAPVTALMLNEARLDDSTRGPAPRAADPAADAAARFAELLRDRGVGTSRPTQAKAPGTTGTTGTAGKHSRVEQLAAVRSAPLSALVERMLTNSDNDIAEALARHTARADGHKADFAGAERAVRNRLAKLDLPMSGTRFADGSGLSRADRVSARFLTELLVRAADPDHPELRSLLTGLPVAGFNGTLGGRYAADSVSGGAGLVRAKTGTLTGVNSLAGTVVDADGRLLAFAFMTTGTQYPYSAQAALDRLATAVAGCGCR
ncbi:D-alanyl-D-alanine carboxypeptidase/D-alanyl-D-alanine endopeptidase [Streptomyces gobiensis]|uniref:D-alanyl-D-alanine carboxypeptidase/D-alanyl-D-alanine endopeptidase n=1 Tax=Streptomyces gobiensis TaxID=2875706 RepID=UPI001E29B466|nr:D-alanyl-D-alanine carboxypeptidase/D-alanyl-D-alanine-endopeptidase [Streptomyces gobiensis]UGY92233.1 D-alanyl-D-alanine carboxypeptidase/D-alanyl-D-alanine-endopeptidase [Streptomyces gobiensis]